jgi:hypothetical protein
MKMREPFSRQIMTVDRSNNFVLITVAMGYRDAYSSKISMQKGDSVHTVKHRSSAFNTERIADLYQDPHVPDQRIVQHGRNVTDSTNLIRIIQQGIAQHRATSRSPSRRRKTSPIPMASARCGRGQAFEDRRSASIVRRGRQPPV